MNRLPPDTRRTILRQKLRGASNREAAERTSVSKGTVANVISEARAGEIEPFDRLEDDVDGLIELGKRLRDADVDLRTALIGLDVIELMEEFDLDATSLQEFREQFNAIGNRDASLDAYVKTIVQI